MGLSSPEALSNMLQRPPTDPLDPVDPARLRRRRDVRARSATRRRRGNYSYKHEVTAADLAGASATTALGLFGGTSVTQAKAPMMNTNYRKRLRRLGAGLRHGGNSEVARQT